MEQFASARLGTMRNVPPGFRADWVQVLSDAQGRSTFSDSYLEADLFVLPRRATFFTFLFRFIFPRFFSHFLQRSANKKTWIHRCLEKGCFYQVPLALCKLGGGF